MDEILIEANLAKVFIVGKSKDGRAIIGFSSDETEVLVTLLRQELADTKRFEHVISANRQSEFDETACSQGAKEAQLQILSCQLSNLIGLAKSLVRPLAVDEAPKK